MPKPIPPHAKLARLRVVRISRACKVYVRFRGAILGRSREELESRLRFGMGQPAVAVRVMAHEEHIRVKGDEEALVDVPLAETPIADGAGSGFILSHRTRPRAPCVRLPGALS